MGQTRARAEETFDFESAARSQIWAHLLDSQGVNKSPTFCRLSVCHS